MLVEIIVMTDNQSNYPSEKRYILIKECTLTERAFIKSLGSSYSDDHVKGLLLDGQYIFMEDLEVVKEAFAGKEESEEKVDEL